MKSITKSPLPSTDEASKTLEQRILHRKASLTEGESAFLHALLVDPAPRAASSTSQGDVHLKQLAEAARKLDDDILFSLPFDENSTTPQQQQQGTHQKAPPKSKRRTSNWVGLWKAFEEGARPSWFIQRAPSKPKEKPPNVITQLRLRAKTDDREQLDNAQAHPGIVREDSSNDDSIHSDEKILDDARLGDDDSSASSWGSEQMEHYDAWAVLKDEYAEDFGFDFSLRTTPQLEEDEEGNKFLILGTSADDQSAQPHVLSPPLMDSLLNFLPEALSKQNWWLKYSLVRDGASLNTFKRYVRGAQHTVLAIETTDGHVFGAFTSSTWRTNPRFYGSGEAFLWKMRYNRMTPCSSLFEQAQLESDIDVYSYSHLNRFVQLSTHDMLAIGGGELSEPAEEHDKDDDTVETPLHFQVELDEDTGFGIALTDDLLRGTSSPCATFRNPCLVHHSSRGETFEVVNIEAWTFTPCYNVNSAEKLEMSKFFIQESTRTVSSTEHSLDEFMESSRCSSPSCNLTSSVASASGRSPRFSSRDFVQQEFYRRLGEEDESEVNRDGWAYANLMGGAGI